MSKAVTVSTDIQTKMKPAESFPVKGTTAKGTTPYTYLWTSTAGGTFTNPTSKNTVYKAPAFTSNIQDQITLTVVDACGRTNFEKKVITGDVTLPISLISFTGKRTGKKVDLKWSTATEVNNEYFTIERSPDAKTFIEVAKIPGAGNSSATQNYSWTDEVYNKNECYYRISQTDYDGRKEVFNTVFIPEDDAFSNKGVLVARPNVFNDSFSFEVQSDLEQEGTLMISDMAGKLVDKVNFSLEKGNNLLFYNNTKHLPSGIYIAIFSDGQKNIQSSKIFKQ